MKTFLVALLVAANPIMAVPSENSGDGEPGVYLTGPKDQSAFSVLRDYGTGEVPETEIIFDESGSPFVAMTRFIVVLKPKATVGQVNESLEFVNAKITSMQRGKDVLEIRIPDPERKRGLAEVEAVAKSLRQLGPFKDALPLSFQ